MMFKQVKECFGLKSVCLELLFKENMYLEIKSYILELKLKFMFAWLKKYI